MTDSNTADFTEKLQERRSPIASIELAVCVLVALVCLVGPWMVPRPIGDLYVGLAAGRDAFAGKLGQPDEWSFTTEGRVWINQNWGTHLVQFLAWTAGQEHGLLVLKALMIMAAAGGVALAARQRGARTSIAILVGGAVLAASWRFVDLRPNLTQLMAVPIMLWLLYRSGKKPHRIWLAMVWLWLWSNSHGSFIFGLGMMGLWMLCGVIAAVFEDGIRAGLRKTWPLIAATGGALLLASFANPFFIENITHPFLVGREAEWRSVSEWHPIFTQGFASPVEFFVVLSVLAGVVCARSIIESLMDRKPLTLEAASKVLFVFAMAIAMIVMGIIHLPKIDSRMVGVKGPIEWFTIVCGVVAIILVISAGLTISRLISGRRQFAKPKASQIGVEIFEIIIVALTFVMAVKARRFLPLATIVSGTIVAVQLSALLRLGGPKLRWLGLPVGLAVLIPASMLVNNIMPDYDRKNPTRPTGTVFQRMHRVNSDYCNKAVEFINANEISGRAYGDWRWEGFIRWKAPQVQTFIGGRAQQVHDIKIYKLKNMIEDTRSPYTAQILADFRVQLIVLPRSHMGWLWKLVYSPQSMWTFLYCDGDDIILANGSDPQARALIQQAPGGGLTFPDPDAGALSYAMLLSSRSVKASPQQMLDSIIKANQLRPTAIAYETLGRLYGLDKFNFSMVPYLEQEVTRLEKLYAKADVEDTMRILKCRLAITFTLANIFNDLGNAVEGEKYAAEFYKVKNERDTIAAKW